jgi:hypothetical protein
MESATRDLTSDSATALSEAELALRELRLWRTRTPIPSFPLQVLDRWQRLMQEAR